MSEIRFYLDENVQTEVASQLVRKGIDAITVRDLGELGDIDINHLQRAAQMERVLCTHDRGFLQMASQGIVHNGIAFAEQYEATIGGWVKALKKLHETKTAEEMIGQIEFLNVK